MQEEMFKNTDNTNNINSSERMEEELMNTIKMEPIIAKTSIDEEPEVTKKKKKIQITDYFLISLVVILSAVFLMVIFKVM